MDEKKVDIYNEINKMDKLDSYSYSRLLSSYGEKKVIEVLETILSENDKNSSKLEYYVSMVLPYENTAMIDLYDAYISDMGFVSSLTREENIKLTTELHNVVVKINKLLDLIGYEGKSIWISDKVEECLGTCSDLKLLKKLKKLHDEFIQKRNFLVEGNLKLVISFSKKFYKSDCDFNEIVQLGNLGLMRALEKYSPNHNACISTYAYHWVKQSITRNLQYISSSIYTPYNLVSLNISMKKLIRELSIELGKEPSNEMLADRLGISVERVVQIKTVFANTVSLDEPAKGINDNESDCSIIVLIIDDNVNIENDMIFDCMKNDLMAVLKSTLTEQQYNIICHRFSLDNYSFLTLEALGNDLGLTRERVRQIESAVIRKIRNKNSYLKYYLR